MSLLLTLVKTPRPQAVRQMRLDAGELVIGRSAEADWRIDDPDQFVSRAHCTVTGEDGRYSVTDTSSGGLFVDDARAPLGHGRSAVLRDGTRLRLGDYVIEVGIEARGEATEAAYVPVRAEHRAEARPAARPEFDADAFFATPAAEPPRAERPRDLPDPFERTPGFAAEAPPERRGPPAFDDPFTLDPPDADRLRERPAPSAATAPAAAAFDWGEPEPLPEPRPAPPKPAAPRPTAAPPADEAAAAAFLRGLGLDPADAPADAAARMEAFGREYRLMAEGLMQLLRMRAEEKGNARIAQTVVSSRVNPLKFMPTVDDALAVLLAPPSSGFTDAETSIHGAVRDLAQHQVNTWRGTQAALRRMVDRFAPEALEKELEALGLLETLLAGGRRAKLWELYEKRFRDIARSAETRFLGEVGADFRDAYETEED
jgi:type VI secretion system protein ImpI